MTAKPDRTGISKTESYPVNPCFGSNTIPRPINVVPNSIATSSVLYFI